jgi:hypothetical protein
MNFYKIKKNIFFLKNILKNNNKEKRKFILAGFLNVFITNLFLQILLLTNLLNLFLTTLFCQLINMSLGYAIYSSFIFKVKNINNSIFIRKYSFLMFTIWLINALGIKAGNLIGITKNSSALIMLPLLAFISFLVQKFWVFK